MRFAPNEVIRTLVPITADFSDTTIPAGTIGTIVECYDNPEGYAVDLAIPDDTLVGGFAYENVILTPDQFAPIGPQQAKPADGAAAGAAAPPHAGRQVP